MNSEKEVHLDCAILAPSRISTLDVTRWSYNADNQIVGNVIAFSFEDNNYVGVTEYEFSAWDQLLDCDMQGVSRVEYVVKVTDSYNRSTTVIYTVNIISSSILLTADWSETIYLSKQSQASWSSIDGIPVNQYENTTIGVSVGTGTSTEINFSTTYNCEGFVIVSNDDYTFVEQLTEAYNAGEVVTSSSVSFDYLAKAFSSKTFISKVDNEYVLVKIVSAVVSPNGANGVSGTVLGFKYKKKQLVA